MKADYRTVAPPITVSSGYDSWGYSATGKLRFPQAGTYTFNIYHDDSMRLWVDDQLIIDDWTYVGDTQKHTTSINFTATTTKAYRFRVDFANRGNNHMQDIWMTGPGITDQSGTGLGTQNWASYLSPGYNLTTSSKVYDATLGNKTATTGYGTNPELGLIQSSTADPTGLNLSTATTYESPNTTGSFLRPLTQSLPGSPSNNPTFSYVYYSQTETRDNPCTTGTTEAFKQGGFIKVKSDADPDGVDSQTARKAEAVYDDAGRIIATRYNAEPWRCMAYDARGRMSLISVPAYGSSDSRTIEYDYSVGGNPLVMTVWDGNGWIVVWSDLLGRTTKYRDVYDDETTTSYDSLGRISQRVSPLGIETATFDSYNRLVSQKLDSVTYAIVSYDQYGRIDYVDYPNAGQQRVTYGRDALGRQTSLTYKLGNGTTMVSDTIVRTQSGQIANDIIASDGNELWYTYGYDGADRLTSAAIGPHTYSYDFGAQNNAVCGTGVAANPNSGKNGNRTSQTINGTTTYFCYDYADRLTGSSSALYNSPTYDTHGNMTQIGTSTTPLHLFYDSSDRSTGYEQYNSSTTGVGLYYDRDVQGRIIGRYKNTITNGTWAGAGSWFYHYTGEGDTPDYVRDNTWAIVEKTLHLPGGVLLSIKPQQTGNAQKQYSLPSIHGDTLITTDATGANSSNGNGPANSFTYDPFGNILNGSNHAANTVQGSYGWVGQYEKLTETDFALTPILMGARVYLPSVGRFAQVDPLDGGTANAYVYPLNPISNFDLDGTKEISILGYNPIISSPVNSMHADCRLNGYIACSAHFTMVAGLAVGAMAAAELIAPIVPFLVTKNQQFTMVAKSFYSNTVNFGSLAKEYLRNGNNAFRAGKVGGKFRISTGPGFKKFNQLPFARKLLYPISTHFELRYAKITFNWIRKAGNAVRVVLWGK